MVRYFLYKRVWSCFFLALFLAGSLFCLTICLSLFGYGVSFANITGQHEYKVSNPITIVSFSATFVTISLTIIGFALNSFSKRKQNSNSDLVLGNSVYEEAAGILLVRYRTKLGSLLYFNVFNFPLLGKAFSLILLLACMFIHCFVGYYRVFYLIVYASFMFCIIVDMLICVFEIYSDVNFTTFKACRILITKIGDRLKFLSDTNAKASKGFFIPALRRYARTDIFRAVVFLHKGLTQVLYKPVIFGKTSIENIKEHHIFAELSLCSDSSRDMMMGTSDFKDEDDNKRKKEIDDAFEFFITKLIEYNESYKSDLESEIKFIEEVDESNYYHASKDKILKQLNYYHSKIEKEETNNEKVGEE